MFRRFLLGLACLLGCQLAPAQPAPPKSSFAAYHSRFEQQRRRLSDAHQYPGLLRAYAEWHHRYDQLPAAEQAGFRDQLPLMYYNEACYYALARQAAPAVRCFGQAVATGWRDYQQATTDPDLDLLRPDPDFQRHLAALREVGDYLYVLKQAGPYASSPAPAAAPLPAYTYQPAAAPPLAALRQRYRLDSIAGQQTDVARCINLLHWVHNQVPHDGASANPAARNAAALLAVCRREQRGLNCRGLATVLNEAYLALGYAAHLVTCSPKDTTDTDCHVLNVVYAPSLRKWLWMDATNDAYVMDEQGTLLGIEEVRARLLDGRPLLLNPTANWNHRESLTKEQYLYTYMAKNIYRLEVPLASQYDYETSQPGRTYAYVQLLPQAAQAPRPAVSTRRYPASGTTYTIYATSDPAAFWQAPPATPTR